MSDACCGDDMAARLAGGDRRSIGRADEVVAEVLDDPSHFARLFAAIEHHDPVVRMRAADAVEKISARRADLLRPYKRDLLDRIAQLPQQEVRWHVAQMLPRLDLTARERSAAVAILVGYLEDTSRIVRTCAMQALADLALVDAGLRPRVLPLLEELTRTGSPAMRSRGRTLLARLSRAARTEDVDLPPA